MGVIVVKIEIKKQIVAVTEGILNLALRITHYRQLW